jgi:hypothetical protein
MPDINHLYDKSDKMDSYTNSMTETMVKATGRTLDEWVEIARSCPATKPKERLKWFKETHGIMQNRAMLIFSTLDGSTIGGYDDPVALVDALFAKFATQVPLYQSLILAIKTALPSSLILARKTYVTLQRNHTFAVVFPSKQGLTLGLALAKSSTDYPGLLPITKPMGGSDRMTRYLILTEAGDLNDHLVGLITEAYNQS